jgi:hypothetical protein
MVVNNNEQKMSWQEQERFLDYDKALIVKTTLETERVPVKIRRRKKTNSNGTIVDVFCVMVGKSLKKVKPEPDQKEKNPPHRKDKKAKEKARKAY